LSLKITGIMIFESSIFIFFYLIFLSLFYYQYHYKKTLLNIPLIYELLNLHANSNETNINK
jgi:hypothetical protein